MKKRALSWLLAVVMVVSLAPQTIPWAKAADPTSTPASQAKNAFGLTMEEKEAITEEAKLKNNPYGTTAWIPLFQDHELVVAGVHDDEFQTTYTGGAGGKGSQMSSFRWGHGNYDIGNARRLVNVAFDPYGTGRDEYIATLAFDDDADRLRLYVTNKDRNVVSAIDLCGDDAAFIDKLKFYQTRAMLCIEAGDFDGDGKDTLMVYVPGNNTDTDSVDSIKEYKLADSKLSYTNRKINLGDVLDGGREALKAMLYHNGNGSNELRAHLSVDMAVGDVDMDGVEELAVTVNVNDLPKTEYNGKKGHEKSYLAVYDYADDWNQSAKWGLGSGSGRARFAGVTIGYVNAAPATGTAPSVVAVGYRDKNSNNENCDLNTGSYRVEGYTYSGGSWRHTNNDVSLDANGFTNTGTKGDDNQNPLAVAAVSADGAMTQEYLFVSGTMYKLGSGSGQVGDTGYDKNRGINGYIINNTGILDYAVGNFDGNKQGREQVYYVEYHKQESFHKEFLRIGQLYKTGLTTTNADGEKIHTASDKFSRWTDGWTYYGKKNCNVALTAADVNNDAVLAKIEEISYGYNDPKIMAILEASPHFSELNDGDIGNSETSFGRSKSESINAETSGSFGFDVMAGFEYVAPVIETGGGIEFNTSHTFTFGNLTEKTKTVEVQYSNDTNESQVVMYATPMTYYKYRVKNPDDGSAQAESTMYLAVAGQPATNMVTVEEYNQAAASYNMDLIGEGVLGSPGKPNTYRSNLPNATAQSWEYPGDTSWGNYSGSATTTQNITDENGEGKSFSYEYEGSVQAYGIVGGFKAGGGVHWGASTSKETMTTEGITKAGTVTGGGNKNYDFNWKFATWTTHLNGADVPILGYLVKNVKAPPSPAQDLVLSDQTTTTMKLSWEEGDRPADYYKIWRKTQEGTGESYGLVAQVSAASKNGSYEYELTDLSPNYQYEYVITAGSYTTGLESVYSEAVVGRTLAADLKHPEILLTPTSKDEAGNLSISGELDTTVQLAVNVILYDYKNNTLQWQERLAGDRWRNIDGATSNICKIKVTSDRIGAKYRCVVTAQTGAVDRVPFYSDVVLLKVGTPNASVGMTLSGAKSGEGSKDTPYIGQSNYDEVTQSTEPTQVTRADTVAYNGDTLLVFRTGNQQYVGVTDPKQADENNADTTKYYALTRSENGQYAVGNELTLTDTKTYTKKDGNETVAVPADSQDPDYPTLVSVMINGQQEQGVNTIKLNQNGTTENGYVYLDGSIYRQTNGQKITDDGNYYQLYGESADGNTLFVSQAKRDVNSGDDNADEGKTSYDTTVHYYIITLTTNAGNQGVSITKTEITQKIKQTLKGDGFEDVINPVFTAAQTEITEDVTTESRTAKNGTDITLGIETKRQDTGVALGGMQYTITIVNTTTGAVSTLSGTTDAKGEASHTWRAPVSGLYAITTVTASGAKATSETLYYLAGIRELVNNTAKPESVYTLDAPITMNYGESKAITLYKQEMTKENETISANKNEVTDNDVTYMARLAGETREEALSNKSFVPSMAGSYVITAYRNKGQENEEKLASTNVIVERANLILKPVWGEDDNCDAYSAPETIRGISVKNINGLIETDKNLLDAVKVSCGLYKANGGRDETLSGRYDVTLSVDTSNKKAAELLKKYNITMQSGMLIRVQNTGAVKYNAGENGKLTARYNASFNQAFPSGQSIPIGDQLTFTAIPNGSGYKVSGWKINGQPLDSSNTNYVIQNSTQSNAQILIIKEFKTENIAADTNALTVEVTFSSAAHTITYSVDNSGGGDLTAKSNSQEVKSGQTVADGASVTFTAAPADGKAVKHWMVDNKTYTWPDTTNPYRENTLTLTDVKKAHTVSVAFEDAQNSTVTANVETETGVSETSLTLSAKRGETTVDLTKKNNAPIGSVIRFTLSGTGLGNNITVKEWKVDGKIVTGSGGKDSFDLYVTKDSHTVTAVVAVAQHYTVTFANAMDGEITTATVTAKSNGKSIDTGDSVAAYLPIEFTAAMNENYYVTRWTGATQDETNPNKATISSLSSNATVSVQTAKKPVVTFSGDENKNITVTAMQGGNKLMSDHWVEMSSGDIIFTATPKKGWETKEWKSGSTKLNSTAPTSDTDDNTTYTQSGPITGNVNIQVTAQEIPQYNLKLSVQDLSDGTYGGTVSANITRKQLEEYKNPITATTSTKEDFYRDSDIVITATPAEGYCVQEWTIDGVTKPTRAKTWTLPNWQQNAEVKVRFVKEVSGITFGPVGESSEEGYISAAVSNDESILSSAASGVNIAAGQPISFTATAQPGYEVEGWYVNNVRDDNAGKKTIYTYPNSTSKSSIYIEPKFQQVEYNITTGDNVKVNDQTSVTARGGTSLTFKATPPTGKQVTGWTVNGEAVPGSGNTLTWTVKNGYTTESTVTAYHVEAQFSAGEYSVTYDQPTGGSLTASVDRGARVNGGTNVTFQATPQEGYEIDKWTVNNAPVSAGDTYTLNVTENSTVAVSFKKMMKVTAFVTGQPGKITITAGGKTVTDGWVSSGTDVTFTVTPDHADDMVQVWKVGETPVAEMSDTADAPLTWTVDKIAADTAVSVTLIERPTYTITITPEGNGTVKAESTSVKRGGSTTITATPKNTNYYLKKWVVDDSDRAASGKTLTLREIRKDTTVKAVFDEAISYNVTLDVQGATAGTTVTATANGSEIKPGATSPANVVGGSELVFTAKPATNDEGNNTQMVAEWTVKGHPELTTIANVLKIPSLTSATEVTVKFVSYEGFAIPTDGTSYTVTDISRTPKDTKPDNEIRKDGTLKFTVTPKDGKLFNKLTVSGVNCLLEPTTGNITAVKDGTSYKITIQKATGGITLDAQAAEYQTVSDPLDKVPSELNKVFTTVEELKTALRTHISTSVSTSNIAYLNVELQYKRGNEWVKVTDPSMFPDGGLDVTIPYSTLSTTTTLDSSYNYSVVHMFLTNMNNQTVGSTETLTATAGTKGITFHVNSLSPFAIGWYKNTPTPGGGGGGGAVSTYTLTFDTNDGSAIDKITKDSGTTIDLAAYKPTRAGYTFAGWFSDKALTKAVTSVKLTANTTVYAKWTQNGGTAQNPFVDVKEGAYYYDAVLWAVEQKITSGTSATTFSPDASCTRAQMVTFLWRAAGSPKVENGKNPFTDVQADAYYYDAVLWAVEKGVTSGTSATTFSPDATVTRGQTVTFLYRNAGSPEVSGTMPFTDVEADAYYAKAVQWAVQQKITTGTSETTFSPMSDCTRGQIVTFLYRAK